MRNGNNTGGNGQNGANSTNLNGNNGQSKIDMLANFNFGEDDDFLNPNSSLNNNASVSTGATNFAIRNLQSTSKTKKQMPIQGLTQKISKVNCQKEPFQS